MRKFLANKWFGLVLFAGILLGNAFKSTKEPLVDEHPETLVAEQVDFQVNDGVKDDVPNPIEGHANVTLQTPKKSPS